MNSRCLLIPLLAGVFSLSARSQAAEIFEVDEQAGSESLATLVLVEQLADDLKFTLSIVDTTNIGDLRGIFFHVADESLLPGLSASGVHIHGETVFDANNVNKIQINAPHVNINPLGPFDAGIEIGTGNGAGGPDDIQATTFVLTHSSQALNVNTFFPKSIPGGFVMGIRGQSVGPPGSARDGSAKQGAFQAVPEPSTMALMGIGLAGGLAARRRKKKRATAEQTQTADAA